MRFGFLANISRIITRCALSQAGMYSIKDFNILPKRDSSAGLHKKREGGNPLWLAGGGAAMVTKGAVPTSRWPQGLN